MTNPFGGDEPTVAVGPAAAPIRGQLALQIQGRRHVVRGPSTVGSAESADLVLDAPGVSRLHARLDPVPNGCWVTDLESRNGTFVDGVRVRSALLVPDSQVRFGPVSGTVVVNERPEPIQLWPEPHFGPLIGSSAPMRALFAELSRVAPSEATVLVRGETGTGKELVARALHERSPRARGPFVIFDCGAVPESLFESELFGHTRGAFTGADRARDGAVLAADGGTLFLDEIGELPLSVQPKLLRLLESRTARRVGEATHRPVDVRFVAATHRDLERLVGQGAFREDLYFRLAILNVTVPPLRERREDIPLLLRHFLGDETMLSASDEAAIAEQPLTGNVRELRTIAERLRVLGANAPRAWASPSRAGAGAEPANVELDRPLSDLRDAWVDRLERDYLRGWIDREGYHISSIAEKTGLNRTYLHRLLRKHGLGR